MINKKQTRDLLFKQLVFILFISCAAVMSPPGGPKDETPPELIEVIPPDGTTNFKGGRVELLFSEYLDGNNLMTNANHIRGSAWIKFPRVLCEN